MPRANEGLTKHTLHFYEGDLERLRSFYPELGAAVVVRKLVRQYLTKIEKSSDGETVEIKL